MSHYLTFRLCRYALEKVKIYQIKIQACIAQNRLWDAISTALEILSLLGIQLPRYPNQSDLQSGLIQTKSVLAEKQLEDLLNLPLMTDPHKLAAMQIISSVCTPTYFIAQSLWELMVFQKVQLSLKYGNAPGSAFGYADYGMVLCTVEENVELGYQFAQLASNLLEKLNTKEFLPKTALLINMYLRHWKEHLRETLNPLLDAYQCGLEIGDLEYATFAIAYRFYHSYLVGRELSELEQEIADYVPAIAQFNQELPLNLSQIYRRAILGLISESSSGLEETQYTNQYTLFHLHLNKLILNYLFGDYPQAQRDSATLHQLLNDGAIGLLIVPAFYFYDSLAKIAVADHTSVDNNQKKLKNWANHAPMNYLHKFYLVEAERCRSLGEELEAMKMYDRAISLANEHGYIQEEALANELAAKFYLERGNQKIAKVYLLEARYCYEQWGAEAKVKQLERQYPEFLNRSLHREITQNAITTVGTTGSQVLDLAAVIKASQALSGEIVLEQLLEKLIKILLENAGAVDGFLILETQGKLFIEAEGHLDQIKVLQSTPIDQSRLSTAIVQYVARTQESVVLNDATQESKFSQEPHIIQYQPKSVLCTPLLHQGKLSGILYVENTLTINAFTTERLEVLQLLSTQAAIALENARLYNQLEIRVQERTLELTQANQQLEELTLELQRSNQELEQFAYIASHDLQEPLRAITSYTQMLAKRYQGKLDEKADIYIGFAVDSATRMQHLIKDLLAYSRAGRQALKRCPTDLNLVLQKVLMDLQVAIAENQAQITSAPLPTIRADANQIAQVFQNLISNAMKYRREEAPQIHIKATSNQENWLLTITDNGIGIEPEYCERIFEIFQRLHTSDEYEGTGLGLAISKRIIERHHGQIWVESRLNQGSTFYIELPIAKTLGTMS